LVSFTGQEALGMDEKINERFINYLLVAVLAIFAALYYPLWLTHEELLTHDAIMWFGCYSYVADCFFHGHLPLWDPYGQSGNSFYQNLNLLGLLEPIGLFYFLWVKIWSSSVLNSYIYLSISRIIFMSLGAYLSYGYISGSRVSAKVAAVVFFMAIFSSSLHQNGFVNLFMMMPWILFFSLKYVDNVGEDGASKYLYAAATALGISFNIYVPVYTLFYLFVFYVTGFLTGVVRLPRPSVLLRQRTIRELSIASVIIVLFSAVPLTVYMKDMGSNGELYPYLRSYTSRGLVKQMVSETSAGALSSRHYENNEVTGTFLNLAQSIAPYYWEIKWKLLFHQYFQETFQFIGIASILIIFSTIGLRSRFKYVIILTTVITALAMTSIFAESRAPLFHHKILDAIFPPLKLIKVYESFLGGHLFNLGLLLAVGLSFLRKNDASEKLYKKYLYMRPFIICTLTIYILVFIFLVFAVARYHARAVPPDMEKYFLTIKLITWLNIKTVIYFATVSCLIFFVIYGKNRRWLNHFATYICLILIIFMELLFYNLPSGLRQITLSPNYLKTDDPVVHQPKPYIYRNYRSIYIPGYFRFVTFQEALLKRDAALPDIFHYMGNVVFVSKRYYEFITHVSMDTIFAAAGVTSPKVRFFEKAYIASAREEVLKKMANVSPDSLNDSLLFIETVNPQNYAQVKREISPAQYPRMAVPTLEQNPMERIKKTFPVAGVFSAKHYHRLEPRENDIYGFPKDWQLYALDINNIDGHPLFKNPIPKELLTLEDANIGRIIILKESLAPVMLYGVSRKPAPVFLNSMRTYGDMAYRAEAGPPLEVFTMKDGTVISTKPFDGYLLLDTLERKSSDMDREIKSIAFDANKVTFSVHNEKPGFLYYADGWSPYWKAYDNGKSVEVLKANYNFKAVFIPPGEHIISFVFEPNHYIGALGCYFVALVFALSLIIVLFIRDRRRQQKAGF
jgi:hypothetical protein